MKVAVCRWLCCVGAALIAVVQAPQAMAQSLVDITLASGPLAEVGEDFDVVVRLQTSAGGSAVVGAVDLVFGWDPAVLQFVEIDNTGAANSTASLLPAVGDGGLNDGAPPVDGDGYYLYLAPLGAGLPVDDAGVVITTLRFRPVVPALLTSVSILPMGGVPQIESQVLDGTRPNTEITGQLSGADFAVTNGCLADTNQDGVVTPADFNAWIFQFNLNGPFCDQNSDGLCTPADFNAWVVNFNLGCIP